MTNWPSWLKSVLFLFTGQALAVPQQFGVDLGKRFQAFPELLISRHPLLAVPLLIRGLEQELQDLAGGQAAGQIIKGAVLLPLSTGAIGFAAGGETFDVGRNDSLCFE